MGALSLRVANTGRFTVLFLLTYWKKSVNLKTLDRRVSHSVEMMSWIKAQTETSVLCPAFFILKGEMGKWIF